MKIYTRNGDRGATSLVGGARTGKDDLRVEAYGTADELGAFVALLRDEMRRENAKELAEYTDDLGSVLGVLMSAQASLATPDTGEFIFNAEKVGQLERRIDALCSALPPVKGFTIPGGHPLVSLAHVCRTVCRRAERCTVRASREFAVDPEVLAYLNRLSDYFYALARRLSQALGIEEEYWQP